MKWTRKQSKNHRTKARRILRAKDALQVVVNRNNACAAALLKEQKARAFVALHPGFVYENQTDKRDRYRETT